MVRGEAARTGECNLSRVLLREVNQFLERLELAVGGNENRVRRVVEEVHVHQVVGLIADVLLNRLQHDMRQVGAHDRVAVAGHRIQLRPGLRAAGARLILYDRLLLDQLLENRLLKTRASRHDHARHDQALFRRNDVLDALTLVEDVEQFDAEIAGVPAEIVDLLLAALVRHLSRAHRRGRVDVVHDHQSRVRIPDGGWSRATRKTPADSCIR
jgi:hypothetical protein